MDNKHYELLYIVPLQASSDDIVKKTIEQVNQILKEADVEITKDDNLGKIKLTYPIKHIHHGEYILVEFNSPCNKIKQIDTDLKLLPTVLRHLIIKKDAKLAEAEEARKKKQVLKKIEQSTSEIEAKPKKKEDKETKPIKQEKVDLEELDRKLDEILDESIL